MRNLILIWRIRALKKVIEDFCAISDQLIGLIGLWNIFFWFAEWRQCFKSLLLVFAQRFSIRRFSRWFKLSASFCVSYMHLKKSLSKQIGKKKNKKKDTVTHFYPVTLTINHVPNQLKDLNACQVISYSSRVSRI